MELYKGDYIKNLNKSLFIDGINSYTYLKINTVDLCKNGDYMINSKFKICLNDIEIISGRRMSNILALKRRKNNTEEILLNKFNKGDYVRYIDYKFFEDLPTLLINKCIYKDNKDLININNFDYNINHLVKISYDEANKLNNQYFELKLSKCISNYRNSTCLRHNTHNPKYIWNEKDALKYVFTYNNKYPAANLKAYKCPFCNNIHIGHLKITNTILS